ncbi:hypothetical protein MHU86_23215 [Fragilaria crotonensis]|nr:hypothetical protein MHU86_23215 [Fragilaria crotonensis]
MLLGPKILRHSRLQKPKRRKKLPQVESQLDANTQNEQALQEEAKPVSEKGINLAALAASPTSNPQYPPRVHGAGLLAPPPTPSRHHNFHRDIFLTVTSVHHLHNSCLRVM